jgi:hypothetical protein
MKLKKILKTKKIKLKELNPNLKDKKSQGMKLKIICNMIDYL